jgi:hypothetical protein
MSSPATDALLPVAAIRRIGLAVRVIAVIGAVLFGGIALLVTAAPEVLERAARGYISHRLQVEVGALRAGLPEGGQMLSDAELARKYADQLRAAEERYPSELEALLDKLIGCLCKRDCASRIKARAVFDFALKALPQETRTAMENLRAVAQGRFDAIFDKLRHELTLISTINAVIFVLLFLIALGGKAQRLAVLPAAMLAIATVVSVAIYAVGTNWWWAILTDGYWGWSYLTLDGVIFLLFVDIVVLRGFVTGMIVDALGSVFSVLAPPC